MSDFPIIGICVEDLDRSIRFYSDCLGLHVEQASPGPSAPVIIGPSGQHLTLFQRSADDEGENRNEDVTLLKRKDVIYQIDPDIEARRQVFERSGVQFESIERAWGEYRLEVVDPDGFRIAFVALERHTPEQVLAFLRSGREEVVRVLELFPEDDLTTRPCEATWSANEIVHHLADSEITVYHVVRAAIANPGMTYTANPYDQDMFAAELQYRSRPVTSALNQFVATRQQLESLLANVPGVWGRGVVSAGQFRTVYDYLSMLVIHNLEHIEQINDVRRQISSGNVGSFRDIHSQATKSDSDDTRCP